MMVMKSKLIEVSMYGTIMISSKNSIGLKEILYN